MFDSKRTLKNTLVDGGALGQELEAAALHEQELKREHAVLCKRQTEEIDRLKNEVQRSKEATKHLAEQLDAREFTDITDPDTIRQLQSELAAKDTAIADLRAPAYGTSCCCADRYVASAVLLIGHPPAS